MSGNQDAKGRFTKGNKIGGPRSMTGRKTAFAKHTFEDFMTVAQDADTPHRALIALQQAWEVTTYRDENDRLTRDAQDMLKKFIDKFFPNPPQDLDIQAHGDYLSAALHGHAMQKLEGNDADAGPDDD